MTNEIQNPFADEKPKVVHLEKNESHYEYCRMQMHEIDRTHQRTFMWNLGLCLVVCFLSLFKVYVGGFSLISNAFLSADVESPLMMLCGGMFQIITAMVVVIVAYFAWANFHTLNIFLELWYVIVTLLGVFKLDYITAVVGIVGAVFYFYSLRAMQQEEALSEMEGYPEFHEKFDISKSDIVIQTLLAHQGEHRTKSTLFTTDYSLRKKKKKRAADAIPEDDAAENKAGQMLAETLQKRLDEAKQAKIATETESPAEEETTAEKETPAETEAIVETESPAEAETPVTETAPAQTDMQDLTDEAPVPKQETPAPKPKKQPAANAAPKKQNPNQGGGRKKKKKH